MHNQGTVLAYDRDAARASAMAALLRRLGATSVTATAQDFGHVPAGTSGAVRILLDPSCSGSGTTFSKADPAELAAFVANQTSLLRHALSFRRVVRVVYSTCSVHAEENEAVVAAALAAAPRWRLATALPAWPRRGLPHVGLSEEDSARCIRCCPRRDLCLGFFVACFERRGAWEQGEAV